MKLHGRVPSNRTCARRRSACSAASPSARVRQTRVLNTSGAGHSNRMRRGRQRTLWCFRDGSGHCSLRPCSIRWCGRSRRGDLRWSSVSSGLLAAPLACKSTGCRQVTHGFGVPSPARVDLDCAQAIEAGRLVQVLSDWQSTFRPPVTLLYRPSVRRVPRVRRFIEFVEESFRALEASRGTPAVPGVQPYWAKRGYERASEATGGRVIGRRRAREE
jgi:DNA-binding transcriptional LysR family regulator